MSERFIVSATDHLPQNRIGMTVREEIASRVLAGFIIRAELSGYATMQPVEDAIWYTDKLIEELERTKK